MPRKRNNEIPRLIVPANATLKQIYAKYREKFTAADLQQYTEMQEGVPVEQILVELEGIQGKKKTRRRKRA